VKKISIGLLELEMADLESFWRKTPLSPLRVNALKLAFFCFKKKQNRSNRGQVIIAHSHIPQASTCGHSFIRVD
jgi:hypothetical protein